MEEFELAHRHGPRARLQFSREATGERVDLSPGYRTVVVDTSFSQNLRDMGSFRRDIEMAQVFCDELLERGLDSIDSPRHPNLSLWIAALTTYGRAFKTGVRVTELPSVEMLDSEETRWHHYLLDVRDKHVSHAVNGDEHALVIATLPDSAFMRKSVSRVGISHLEMMPSEDEVQALTALCAKILVGMRKRMRVLESVVTNELMSMGEQAVYALPDLVAPIHDPKNVAKKRKGATPTRRPPKTSR